MKEIAHSVWQLFLIVASGLCAICFWAIGMEGNYPKALFYGVASLILWQGREKP